MSRDVPSYLYLRTFYNRLVGELSADGAASAVHQLWMLRRRSEVSWLEFALFAQKKVQNFDQLCLLSSLWELSKEASLERIAPRLGRLPEDLLTCFTPSHD